MRLIADLLAGLPFALERLIARLLRLSFRTAVAVLGRPKPRRLDAFEPGLIKKHVSIQGLADAAEAACCLYSTISYLRKFCLGIFEWGVGSKCDE